MQSKIIGIDLGTKTMGVAISDSFGMMAHGYDTFVFKSNEFSLAINYIKPLILENNVKTVVLGYPKNMDNSVGKRAKMCEKFRNRLVNECNVTVIMQDERLTTVMANNVLMQQNVKGKDKKKYVDKIAATLILQSYLDSNKGEKL